MTKTDIMMLNGFVPGVVALPPEDQALLDRRLESLGPAYRLFYEKPLHVTRAEDVWLYAADGTKYLDAYNNVASVGHCHPHVVAAIAKQAAELCTHTRYLTPHVVDYAERLLATMPAALKHMMFTCSGSEANDLALRIAQNFTGGQGVIITENAYHGTTHLIAALSPSLGVNVPAHPTTRKIPAPLKGDAQAFAADVQNAIDDMLRCGIKPCALIVDTIFTSDGVAADPIGFLKPAVEAIRKAGGLFIADEVQPGFGRTGSGLWCFARHGIIPDIVTLGKPMGNGYPVAGLAVQPHIVEKFGNTIRYFNTFGGNTVAVAAASAVLDVIESQNLIQNAAKTGAVFAEALRNTNELGAIRAAGLMIAVDVVNGDGSPDAKQCLRIVNGLRDHGVLISASGKAGHTLKIRPPLTFNQTHVDLFMDRLRKVLGSLTSSGN
jgi:4-aminobutyrate aminotransferase-like enzyme